MGIARFLTFDTPPRPSPAARPVAAPSAPKPSAERATPARLTAVPACETMPPQDKIVQLPPVGHLGGHLIFD